MIKKMISNFLIFVLTVTVGFCCAEFALRIKNSDQKNYNIEMWRYSKLLKKKSDDPLLGHEHIPNASARLQGVEILLNSRGMRSKEPPSDLTGKQKILFLGSSNTLGWGVPEKSIMTSIIQKELGDQAIVYNAGIGNYNAVRYVELLDKRLRDIRPDIVIVNYFVNDAEALKPGGGNFFLRHSELAVILYHAFQTLVKPYKTLEDLIAYYHRVYASDSDGRNAMEAALARLDAMSKEMGFKVIFTMVPDIHLTNPYPFDFIHEQMKKIAAKHSWTYVDFSKTLGQVDAKSLWAMPGDPHINSLGQELMAKELLAYLR